MTDETTSEQLAEIEGQAEDTPATEYTPPEGWRVLRFGEQLLPGDVWVSQDGTEQRSNILHWDAASVSGGRCIRRIEPQPQPESEPQPEPIQVREGRWRTRGGLVKDVTAMPTDHDDFLDAYPWWDGDQLTWANNGAFFNDGTAGEDLVEYLGPIEEQPETQQNGLVRDVTHLPQESGVLDSAKAEQQIEELRSEVSYVQNLLGTERRRVTQLEELVSSLRTINMGCENAVRDAGKENFALKNQLAAVKAELANVAADRQRLQIELDAAQQVPADSPELRQLRADLEQVTLGRDTYRDGYDRVLSDLRTIRETTKAATVEAIAEWLEPIRAVDHSNLANETLQHLPQIMRHLTGLDSNAID